MIPGSAHDRQKREEYKKMGGDEIRQFTDELRATRQDIGQEIKDLGRDLSAKIDAMNTSHNDLRLEVAKTDAVQRAKMEKVEKDVTALWDHNREMRRDVSGCIAELDKHKAEEAASAGAKKGVAEWVRWIPGLLFGIIAAVIALFGKI